MDRLTCLHCGQSIGVHEPTWAILADGTAIEGSWVTVQQELEQPDTVALHDSCYRERYPGRAAD
jgi:hypothetical protein